MQLRLILIRHGVTAGNLERRYVGQADDQPLTEHGRQELLTRRQQNGYPAADALYVSPMRRCQETAQLVYPMLVPVTISALAELNFGTFEGKTYEQLKDDPAYRRWVDTAGKSAPPGGESGEEFARRLRDGLRQIAADARRSGNRTVAVVTHGGCIMTMLSQLNDAPKDIDDFYSYLTPNGGGFLAELDTDTLALHAVSPL